MANRVVGLDIGRYAVRAVVLQTGLRSWELVEAAEELIAQEPSPDAITGARETVEAALEQGDDDLQPQLPPGAAEAIARLAARGVLTADAVHVALPRDAAYVTQLDLPFSTEAQVRPVLLPQLDGRLPEEVDELHLDCMVGAPARTGGFIVHAVAIQPARIATLLGELDALRLDPRLMDVEPFVQGTIANAVLGPSAAPIAMLEIGNDSSGLLILHEGRPQFSRTLPGGGEHITRALAQGFQLSLDRARDGKHREGHVDQTQRDASTLVGDDHARVGALCRDAMRGLVRQVRSSLLAHASLSAAPVSKIYVTGATATLPGLLEWMSGSLGVPTALLPAQHAGWQATPGFGERLPSFSTALGLALRGVGRLDGSHLNLRHGPFAFRGGYELLRQRAGALGLGAAAIAASLLVLLSGQYAMQRAETRALEDALGTLTSEVFGEAITSPGSVRSRLELGASSLVLHPERSAFELFVDLANMVGDMQADGTTIEARTVSVDMGRFLFRLEGTSATAEAVDTLQGSIDDLPCFRNLQRNDLSSVPGGTGFRFSLQGAIDCVADPVRPGGNR